MASNPDNGRVLILYLIFQLCFLVLISTPNINREDFTEIKNLDKHDPLSDSIISSKVFFKIDEILRQKKKQNIGQLSAK